MRIISRERDYYDGVAAGMAQTPVYLRVPREEEVEHFPFVHPWAANPWPLSIDTHVVGFCGKLYPVLRVACDNRFTPGSMGTEPVSAFCRSTEDVDRALEAMCQGRDRELWDYYRGNGSGRVRHRPRYSGYVRRDVDRFFQLLAVPSPRWEERMIQERCPVFLATRLSGSRGRRGTITWNARLGGVEFFRVFDPWRAWQELSMWLGGLASPEKPIPAIPDEVMAQAKGFDERSFRKGPSPGRARTPA